MASRKIFTRILKFLGKVLLGLLLFILSVIILIHLPPVQNKITQRLCTFLCAKTKGQVNIQRLEFSILGNVTIKNLSVSDPNSNQIFSAGLIAVRSNIFDILSGDLKFEEIRLEDVSGKLIQDKDGMNINFIVDAFKSKGIQVPDTTSSELTLRCHKILLNNIDFEFLTDVSGTDIHIHLGNLTGDGAAFSTKGSTISADNISMKVPVVKIITKGLQDTITTLTAQTGPQYFSPDFGIGLGFEIKNLQVEDGAFAMHRDTVLITQKFDPNHLVAENIQIHLSDARMNPDSLGATLNSLSVQLPGFAGINASAGVRMNRHQMALSEFSMASNNIELKADLTASYNTTSTNAGEIPDANVKAEVKMNPGDLAYFLNDSIVEYFKHWTPTALTVEGNYIDGKGNLKNLEVTTSNSHLDATGLLNDIIDPENISWQDMNINVDVGSDFQQTIALFSDKVKIPPSVNLQLNTTGNSKKIFVDGKVKSTWGNATAKGNVILLGKDIDLDMNVSGEQVQVNEWASLPMIGTVSLTADAKGKMGEHQDAQVSGVISSIMLMDQPIHQIVFQSNLKKEDIEANIKIEDPDYLLQGHTNVSFGGPLVIKSEFQFDTFHLGRLIKRDSAQVLTGLLATNVTLSDTTIEGKLSGKNIIIKNKHSTWATDSLNVAALLSPSASNIDYKTDDGKGNLTANFDLQKIGDLLQPWIHNIMNPSTKTPLPEGNRTVQFGLQMNNAAPLEMLGLGVTEFSAINVNGKLDEANHEANVHLNSGKFKGYGISLDTLFTDIKLSGDSIKGNLNGNNLFYDTYDLGNLNFDVKTNGDTTIADLDLSHDTVSYVGLGIRILHADGGAYFYPFKLRAFKKDYQFDPANPIFMSDTNVELKQFLITHDNMQLSLNGNRRAFDVNFKNLDITSLSPLMPGEANILHKGYLNGTFTYASGQQLDIKANIDSLVLYNSVPITVTVSAMKDHDELPFQVLLSNETNKVDAHGKYFFKDKSVDGSLLLDIHNPEMFAFLYGSFLENVKGSIRGQATIHGPLEKPQIIGSVRFKDFDVTTLKPRLAFNIKDDSIKLDNSGITLDHFTFYDKENHPLTITGNLNTSNLPAYKYELNIKADDYTLINYPDTVKGQVKGILVLNSDINLSGNEKDTYVKSDIDIKDKTSLTIVLANDDDALLNTIGVVDFVDPGKLIDSAKLASENMYDSIMSSIPDFKFNSKILLDKNASLKIITDAQSGDYFQAYGGANLELSSDRTGNPQLSGNYTIEKGVYRLSFYDLVKKTFTIVPGSSVTWSGSPETGEMDIKAIHTVATNSIGLVGHEIGENEKSVYKRTLDYEVGIIIKGTLEKPIITFSLDLPEQDKASYPLLANKLDRLKLPEFQTELNKQVFGLLVLGGFLPESSVGDIDQSQVATTAIYNSVNAILATQLNRFASQYVKGVDINVGIQSYADYSTPGGKTQTAMDFRVSKSVFNDRLSFEVGGDIDINTDQSGSNTGDNYRGDVAIIYDLTGNGDKQLKLFNNESYDIIYQEIRNTGISLIFIREFDKGDRQKKKAEEKAKAEANNEAKAKAKDKKEKHQ